MADMNLDIEKDSKKKIPRKIYAPRKVDLKNKIKGNPMLRDTKILLQNKPPIHHVPAAGKDPAQESIELIDRQNNITNPPIQNFKNRTYESGTNLFSR